jgi:hypothetical protein
VFAGLSQETWILVVAIATLAASAVPIWFEARDRLAKVKLVVQITPVSPETFDDPARDRVLRIGIRNKGRRRAVDLVTHVLAPTWVTTLHWSNRRGEPRHDSDVEETTEGLTDADGAQHQPVHFIIRRELAGPGQRHSHTYNVHVVIPDDRWSVPLRIRADSEGHRRRQSDTVEDVMLLVPRPVVPTEDEAG